MVTLASHRRRPMPARPTAATAGPSDHSTPCGRKLRGCGRSLCPWGVEWSPAAQRRHRRTPV